MQVFISSTRRRMASLSLFLIGLVFYRGLDKRALVIIVKCLAIVNRL